MMILCTLNWYGPQMMVQSEKSSRSPILDQTRLESPLSGLEVDSMLNILGDAVHQELAHGIGLVIPQARHLVVRCAAILVARRSSEAKEAVARW